MLAYKVGKPIRTTVHKGPLYTKKASSRRPPYEFRHVPHKVTLYIVAHFSAPYGRKSVPPPVPPLQPRCTGSMDAPHCFTSWYTSATRTDGSRTSTLFFPYTSLSSPASSGSCFRSLSLVLMPSFTSSRRLASNHAWVPSAQCSFRRLSYRYQRCTGAANTKQRAQQTLEEISAVKARKRWEYELAGGVGGKPKGSRTNLVSFEALFYLVLFLGSREQSGMSIRKRTGTEYA